MTASTPKPPRVLILSASTGNGHISAAKALQRVCEEKGLISKLVDTLDYAPKGYRLWYAGGYEALVHWMPKVWGLLYRDSDRPKTSFYLQTRLDILFLKRLDALVRDFQPDWILCTHSLPQPRLALLRAQGVRFRVGIVVTDLHPHLMWLRGEPDRYFVPSEWSKQRLLERLPTADSRVEVTGIPVHSAFACAETKVEARKRTGLPLEVPVVLVSAGGIGAGPFGRGVDLLQKVDLPLHAVVICGRNEGLYSRVSDAFRGGRITVKGHIALEDMATFMRSADFMIGKPGGLTSAECCVAGCPLVVYAPFMIPGQEEDNARSLVESGAGLLVENEVELQTVIARLLSSPTELQLLRKNALALAKPNAAPTIIQQLQGE